MDFCSYPPAHLIENLTLIPWAQVSQKSIATDFTDFTDLLLPRSHKDTKVFRQPLWSLRRASRCEHLRLSRRRPPGHPLMAHLKLSGLAKNGRRLDTDCAPLEKDNARF